MGISCRAEQGFCRKPPQTQALWESGPSEPSEIGKTDGTKGDLMFYFLSVLRFFCCFINKRIHTWKQLQYSCNVGWCICWGPSVSALCSFLCIFKPCWETSNYFHIPGYCYEFALVTHTSSVSRMFTVTLLNLHSRGQRYQQPHWCSCHDDEYPHRTPLLRAAFPITAQSSHTQHAASMYLVFWGAS